MLTPELLQQIAAAATAFGIDEHGLAQLRAGWPGVHFTLCSDDEIPPQLPPAHSGDGFNLYLVSNGEHCLRLTTVLSDASGLVLATLDEDD